MTLEVEALDHLVFNVCNAEVSAAWYARVLGMTRSDVPAGAGTAPRTSVRFGAGKAEWFTAEHATPGSADICFLTQSSPRAVVEHLEHCGIAIEQGLIEKRGARGMLTSVYCRDPDGSPIEISSYVS